MHLTTHLTREHQESFGVHGKWLSWGFHVSCMWCWSISAEAFFQTGPNSEFWQPEWFLKCLYFADKKIKGCGNCRPLTSRWGLGRVSLYLLVSCEIFRCVSLHVQAFICEQLVPGST